VPGQNDYLSFRPDIRPVRAWSAWYCGGKRDTGRWPAIAQGVHGGGHTGMIERITILGGNSVYIPEFILSVIAHNLNVREIVLFARPGRKLDLVSAFCGRLVNRSGFPLTIRKSTDIAEAAADTKYVLNHIRVGGMQARMRDEMLPPKWDMIGDENLGAGGFANAMRTLPVVLGYAEQIREVNPDAVFINLTNPMGIVVEGMIRYSGLDTIGVCDLPGQYVRKLAGLLQVDAQQLKVDFVGLHRLGWIQDVRLDKRSRMSKVLELLENGHEDGFDHELIQLFRMIPTRITGAFFHRGEILKKQLSCSRFRSEVLHEAEQQILKLYENENLNEIPDLTRQRNALWYEESVIPLIEALESNRSVEQVLCVRNGGSIRDLPEDCSVEIPTGISRHGVKARKVGSLPGFLKGMFIAAKESDRLTVEAVKHKSREYALQALAINPFVPSFEVAKKFLDLVIKEEKLELH
jgi:6-phospho-beta-glucosidase